MSQEQAVRLRTSLESELTWRRDEVREVRNWAPRGPAIGTSDTHRRVILVMLYAHLEGFVKSALMEYGQVINECGLQAADVHEVIAASCLAGEFKSYRKSDPGDPSDPDGNQSRLVLKDSNLISKIRSLDTAPIRLDLDEVVSTDSNLSPIILRRNLAMLAIDHGDLSAFMGHITSLLKKRNPIAHGEKVDPPDDKELVSIENSVFSVCEKLMKALYEATRDEGYRRLP